MYNEYQNAADTPVDWVGVGIGVVVMIAVGFLIFAATMGWLDDQVPEYLQQRAYELKTYKPAG